MGDARTWLVSAAVVFGLGCDAAVQDECPSIDGVFAATYQQLEGSCEPALPPQSLQVDDTGSDKVTNVENRLADTITTQVTFKGCTLGVQQSVEKKGVMVSRISGDLLVEDESELSGNIMRTEFMEDGSIACHGVYEARYTKRDVVLGAAAQFGGTAE